MKTIRKDLVLE